MKKLFIAGAIPLLLLVILAILVLSTKEYVIVLSQEQLQQKLDDVFPIEKKYLVALTVTLSNPVLNLHEGANRIDFRVDAATKVPLKEHPLKGSGQLSGGIRFDPQEGKFYLDDSRIDELTIEALPDKYADKLKTAASLGVRQFLNRRPIYTLKDSDIKHSIAKLVLKNVIVEKGALKITLGLN